MVNINKHKNEKGNNRCHQHNPVPVKIITAYSGIRVNKKLMPTKTHFENGKMYFGRYTLFISPKFETTLLIAKLDASLK